jgi:hypothetical protein
VALSSLFNHRSHFFEDIDRQIVVTAQGVFPLETLATGTLAETQDAQATSKLFYVDLPGLDGHTVTTPDHVSLDITGDFELIVFLRAATDTSSEGLIEKLAADTGYGIRADPSNGGVQLVWGDGATTHFKGSGTGHWSVDTDTWFRGTLDVNDGASGHIWSLFVSTVNPGDTDPELVDWTPAGTATEVGTTSVAAGSAVLRIGQRDSEFLEGRAYRARVYDGLVADAGTLVADFDAADFAIGESAGDTAIDSVSKTWTINGAQSVILPHTGGQIGVSGSLAETQDDQAASPEFYLDLPDLPNHYARTPYHASFGVTDIDVRVEVVIDDLTQNNYLFATDDHVGERGWFMRAASSTTLRFRWSDDGTTIEGEQVSAPHGFSDGDHWQLRVVVDVDDGASNAQTKFYKRRPGLGLALTNHTNWEQIGADIAFGTTTSIWDATANSLNVGTNDAGIFDPLKGKHFGAVLLDGIDGTPVAHFDGNDFSIGESDTDTGVDATGKTWTILGDASVILPFTGGQLGADGTLAETQDDQTSAAEGTSGNTGTLAETQDGQTSAASGESQIVGTLAETQADQTSAASGLVWVIGTVAETQDPQTSAVVGFYGVLSLLFATGDGTITDVVNELDAASPLWSSIDDDPATPTDSDWINNTEDEASAFIEITNLPGNFDGMISAQIVPRDRGQEWTAGDRSLYIRLYQSDETTPLSDEVQIADRNGNTAFVNGLVTITGIVAGTKTIWDGARIRYRWSDT